MFFILITEFLTLPWNPPQPSPGLALCVTHTHRGTAAEGELLLLTQPCAEHLRARPGQPHLTCPCAPATGHCLTCISGQQPRSRMQDEAAGELPQGWPLVEGPLPRPPPGQRGRTGPSASSREMSPCLSRSACDTAVRPPALLSLTTLLRLSSPRNHYT